jgi:membrane associated rhomboid family serine protease
MLYAMSTMTPPTKTPPARPGGPGNNLRRGQTQIEGVVLLGGIVVLMWLIEVINTLDSNRLDSDGIAPRSFDHLWGIFTAPFIHASFQHLIDNTIPFLFMGLIIALAGAARLARVTLIVIVIGGLGTWLISPAHTSTGVPVYTIGASGVVFGYATYLFARGFFDRSALELLAGLLVGVVWGGALLSRIVPHTGVSWQGLVCGAIAGVVAALLLKRPRPGSTPKPGSDRSGSTDTLNSTRLTSSGA